MLAKQSLVYMLSPGYFKLHHNKKSHPNLRKHYSFLNLAYWNVGTLFPGFNVSPSDNNTTCKIAKLKRDLVRLNIDICALLETWLADSGSICDAGYTIFWY